MARRRGRDLLIPPGEVEAARLLGWWQHLDPLPGQVLGMSPFGDWFLRDAQGCVSRLDLLEGSVEQLTSSTAAFWSELDAARGLDEWLQAGHVFELERQGLTRREGECYMYALHPRLGGQISVSNMRLGSISAWQLFCSQLHPQLDRIPAGAVIVELRCAADGKLTIDWKPPP